MNKSENTRLLRTGRPKADESFTGYIIRLTEQNGYETPVWIMRMAKIIDGRSPSSGSFVFEALKNLDYLAQVTGTSPVELERLTYPCSSELTSSHLFFGQLVPRYLLRPGQPRICPECLRETNYCRRIWDLSLVTTCLAHRCQLIDECPKCNKQISSIRNQISICSCEFDWREASVLSVDEQELRLTRHIYGLCGLQVEDGHMHFIDKNPALSFSLRDFISIIIFIAGHLQGISSSTGRYLEPKGNNNELHALFTKSYSILEKWPVNYHHFLDGICARQRAIPLIRKRQKSPLYKDFGKFFLDLYQTPLSNHSDFLRTAFTDYLEKTWEGFYLSNHSYKKAMTDCFAKKCIAKTDALRLLGVDAGKLDQLIKSGELKAMVRSKGKKRLIFIELKRVAELKRKPDKGRIS